MIAFPLGRRTELTVEEYFALAADSEISHEFYEGEIIARTGIQRDHIMITGNVMGQLHIQLTNRAECIALASTMRVRVSDTIYFYPDGLAVCDARFADPDEYTLTNPCLVVEVTSESTAMYDRLTKLAAYRQMPSVQEILIVDQYRVAIEQHTRVPEGWLVREFTEPDEKILLESLGCTLAVSDVYAKVTFEA